MNEEEGSMEATKMNEKECNHVVAKDKVNLFDEWIEEPPHFNEDDSLITSVDEFEEEELLKSMPKMEEDFINNVFDCECAGTERNQPIAEKCEEQIAQAKYGKEDLSDKEMQNLENEIKLIVDLMNGRAAEKENSSDNNVDCLMVDYVCTSVVEVEKGEDLTYSFGSSFQ